MNKEQQELLDEAYQNYSTIHKYAIRTEGDRSQLAIESLEKQLIYTQEKFINKCKTDDEFSKRWGLMIEERELSRNERSDYYYKNGNSEGIVVGSLDRPIFEEDEVAHKWYDERNVPTKLITITYNDKTIESYE
jgi:hypothetical protein